MDVELRSSNDGDLAEVSALLAAEGLPTEDLNADALALVAECKGALLGAIGLEAYGNVGLLRSLVVAQSGRGKGLGASLVNALERHARKVGVEALWLLTIDADAWFKALGYDVRARTQAPEAIAATEEFSSLCPDDAVLMCKHL